jgi:hypothetical protein
MALAPLVPGFTRFSGETHTTKPSGLVLEGGNGTSYYFWFDNNGSLRTATAATAEAAAFNWQTGGTIVGGGTASGITAIPDLAGTVGTANDTMTAIANPTDSPATADALRDDLVAVLIPALNNNLADLQTKVNAILAALRTAGVIAT